MLRLCVVVVAAALAGPSSVLPAGTRLTARMNTTIGTVKAMGPDRIADVTRPGQEYAASLIDPVVDDNGRVLVPAGAVVHGRVAMIARGTGIHRAKLELTAERLDRRPIEARVVEPEIQQLPTTDPGKTADSAAFAGALLGGIAFGIPGVVIGFAFGGGQGGVGVVRERVTEGWLSAGAPITIELTAPLAISQRY
jgi:hypothetical protein